MPTLWHPLLPLALGFALAGPVWGLGGRDGAPPPALRGEARAPWKPVIEAGARDGVPAEHLERTAAHLAASGLSVEEGWAVLAPAFRAAREGLPAGPVLAKLDEGAQKGASAEALVGAGESRRRVLDGARALLGARGYPDGEGRGQGLVVATALALESGVPEDVLVAVLDRGRGSPPGPVKAVVEAGETLHLAGLDPATVAALMTDCLDRDLRRPEVLRVVRFAQEAARTGRGGPAIRESLWGGGGGGHRGSSPAGGTGTPGGGPGGGGAGGPGGRHRGGSR